MSRKLAFVFAVVLLACSSAEDTQSASSAVSACWDPSFGTYACYQGDWWLEFSVKDTSVTSIHVEVQPSRSVTLSNRVDLGGG
jgi:ABC-type Fe3+-hydroxamate transport system substrate-binding protein